MTSKNVRLTLIVIAEGLLNGSDENELMPDDDL
jgi:hypothetical protein